MKWSLATVLFGIAALTVAGLMIVRKSFFGLLIVLGMTVLYFVLTIVSEAIKIHGEKTEGRNRHP
jgi:hypothetical protein